MDIRGQTKPNLLADPNSAYKEAHGTMVIEIFFLVSGLNTLSVLVAVVSLSGLCPVRVVSLSELCPCPGCVCQGWPQLAPVGPGWPRLAPVGPTPVGCDWPRLTQIGPIWPCFALFGPFCECLAPFSSIWIRRNTQRLPSGNRQKAEGSVGSKDWTSSISRRTMPQEDSPCLKEREGYVIREKDLDYPVLTQ